MNFLKSILGVKWQRRLFLLIVIYLILLFWPTLIFYAQINFEPAAFVQEWLKSVCSISIIFLVLEYQKYLFDLSRRKNACRDTIERKIINPLQEFLNIPKNWNSPNQNEIDKLIVSWNLFYKNIAIVDLYSFNVKIRNEELLDYKNHFKMSDLNEIIIGMVRASPPFNLSAIEARFQDIISQFQNEADQLK
jgi:hypothetical protein